MIMTRIKQCRKEKGMSQKAMAIQLQTSQQHYSDYENGKVEMPLFQFRNICMILNVSADYLLELSDTKEKK